MKTNSKDKNKKIINDIQIVSTLNPRLYESCYFRVVISRVVTQKNKKLSAYSYRYRRPPTEGIVHSCCTISSLDSRSGLGRSHDKSLWCFKHVHWLFEYILSESDSFTGCSALFPCPCVVRGDSHRVTVQASTGQACAEA